MKKHLTRHGLKGSLDAELRRQASKTTAFFGSACKRRSTELRLERLTGIK
jgi:hypothetical protein